MSLPCQLPRYFLLLPLPRGQSQNHLFLEPLLAMSSLLFYSKGLCQHQACPGSPGQPPGRPQRSSALQPPHQLTRPLTGSQEWTCVGSGHLLIPERPLVNVHTVALSLEIGIHSFNSIHSHQPESKTTPAVRPEGERTVAPKGCGNRPRSPLPGSAPALSRTCASGHQPVTPGSKTAGTGSQQPVFQAGHRRVTLGLLHGLEATPLLHLAPYSAQPHSVSNKIMKPGLTFPREAQEH